MTFRDANAEISEYHAHIYYDAQTRETAGLLRGEMDTRFNVSLGRWHDMPVGPHPKAMYQVLFAPEEFGKLVPWLMINRRGLDILVHPDSGNDLTDHRDDALWLGAKLALKIDIFDK